MWRDEIVLLSADGVMRRTGRQLGEERHSEHQPEAYCRGTPLGGRSVIRALSDFRMGTRHALKRLSILASFCQLYKYKLFFQLL